MPVARQPSFYGPIAQWLEQTTHNRLVGGSNPSGPTIFMSTAGHQLIYDDVCGFCQRSVRLLRRLDWFRTIDPVPMSAAAAAAPAPFLSAQMTLAPFCANRRAVSLPMPDAAPVTNAVLPPKLTVVLPSV